MPIKQTVTVYTKPNCSQCEMTKRWLKARDVAYELADITDSCNLDAAKSLRYTAAPSSSSPRATPPPTSTGPACSPTSSPHTSSSTSECRTNSWLIPSWVDAIALALIVIVAATIVIVGAIVGIRNDIAAGVEQQWAHNTKCMAHLTGSHGRSDPNVGGWPPHVRPGVVGVMPYMPA